MVGRVITCSITRDNTGLGGHCSLAAMQGCGPQCRALTWQQLWRAVAAQLAAVRVRLSVHAVLLSASQPLHDTATPCSADMPGVGAVGHWFVSRIIEHQLHGTRSTTQGSQQVLVMRLCACSTTAGCATHWREKSGSRPHLSLGHGSGRAWAPVLMYAMQ
jgi:hypothetical protein